MTKDIILIGITIVILQCIIIYGASLLPLRLSVDFILFETVSVVIIASNNNHIHKGKETNQISTK
jgi:hypothetical protein